MTTSRMYSVVARSVFALLLAVSIPFLPVAARAPSVASPEAALVMTVSILDDAVDANPGDGVCADAQSRCTLRAAVMEANALPGPDTIVLSQSGHYAFGLQGRGEQAAATGDLDVTDSLTITGSGQALTMINAMHHDRVFDVRGGATLILNDLTVMGGDADADWAGAIDISGTVVLQRATLSGNKDNFLAGAIRTQAASTLHARDSIIRNNAGGTGAGGVMNAGTVYLTNTVLTGNTGTDAGALRNVGGYVRIMNSLLDDNHVEGNGGALVNEGGGVLEIINTTISGNTAGYGDGGALRTDLNSRVYITNSTVVSNSARTGGGVFAAFGAVVSIAHSTFADNVGVGFGGDSLVNAGNLASINSTASIFVSASPATNCQGSITSQGYNLENGTTCGLGGTGDISGTDPRLGPLAAELSAQPTRRLVEDSPALDVVPASACPVASDQRGVLRPQGAGCDIGAYELKHWTYMLYLDGDTAQTGSLDAEIGAAVARLQAMPKNPYVSIVIRRDGPGYRNIFGNLQPDSYDIVVQPVSSVTSIGEVNMGHGGTLSSFVLWARAAYPAQHYYLAITNHGHGMAGIAWDDTSVGDRLTPGELRGALLAATQNGAAPIDVLHLDACTLAMFEQAYELHDVARYLVASQNLMWMVMNYNSGVPSAGLALAETVRATSAVMTTETEPRAQAAMVAWQYHIALPTYPHTISALDLGQVHEVLTATTVLADALRTALPQAGVFTTVAALRSAVQKFDSRDYLRITEEDEFIDLYDAARRLYYAPVPQSVRLAASALLNTRTRFVIQEQHTSGSYQGTSWNLSGSTGVSIYWPPNMGSWDYLTYRSDGIFQMTANSTWDEFVVDYVTRVPPPSGAPVDPGVPPLAIVRVVYLPAVMR